MQCLLRERRAQLRMTQEELSNNSGISRATISALESGELRNAKVDTLRRLADTLQCKVSDIFLI